MAQNTLIMSDNNIRQTILIFFCRYDQTSYRLLAVLKIIGFVHSFMIFCLFSSRTCLYFYYRRRQNLSEKKYMQIYLHDSVILPVKYAFYVVHYSMLRRTDSKTNYEFEITVLVNLR